MQRPRIDVGELFKQCIDAFPELERIAVVERDRAFDAAVSRSTGVPQRLFGCAKCGRGRARDVVNFERP